MLRKCFEKILTGEWREHDPYDLQGRLDARSSLYGRPNQVGIYPFIGLSRKLSVLSVDRL